MVGGPEAGDAVADAALGELGGEGEGVAAEEGGGLGGGGRWWGPFLLVDGEDAFDFALVGV